MYKVHNWGARDQDAWLNVSHPNEGRVSVCPYPLLPFWPPPPSYSW